MYVDLTSIEKGGGEGGPSGALSLSEDELDLVSAGVLEIGDTDNSGGIYVTDAVSFADAGNEVVHLVTGSGDITSDGSGSALQVAGRAARSILTAITRSARWR